MKRIIFTTAFYIFSLQAQSQNVGIGITTPLAPLHIKSTTSAEVLRAEGINPFISFWDNTTGYRGSIVSRATNMELYNGLPITISPGFTPSTTFLNNGNVGIGITTPISKLEVMNPLKSTIRISSTNYTDSSSLVLSNRTLSGAGTDFILSSNQETGLNISSASDVAGNNSSSILFLNPQGNVGVGTINPINKLDVAGDMNISGALKVAGISGTLGQVLVSNGASPATWQNTALSNNTRFSVTMPYVTEGVGNMSFTTRYNLNPANVTIGANSITINQAGLYHFEGHLASYVFNPAPTSSPYYGFNFNTGSLTYEIRRNNNISLQASTGFYGDNLNFSIDIYFNAFQTLTLGYTFFAGGSTTTSLDGWFTGYLISN